MTDKGFHRKIASIHDEGLASIILQPVAGSWFVTSDAARLAGRAERARQDRNPRSSPLAFRALPACLAIPAHTLRALDRPPGIAVRRSLGQFIVHLSTFTISISIRHPPPLALPRYDCIPQ